MPDIPHRIGIERTTPESVCQAVASREGIASWWTENVTGEATVGAVLSAMMLITLYHHPTSEVL